MDVNQADGWLSHFELQFAVSAGGMFLSAIAPSHCDLAFEGRTLRVNVEHFSHRQHDHYQSVEAQIAVLV